MHYIYNVQLSVFIDPSFIFLNYTHIRYSMLIKEILFIKDIFLLDISRKSIQNIEQLETKSMSHLSKDLFLK